MSRYQSVRLVGAPTANIPATSGDKTRKNRQVVKSIIDSPWGGFSFSLLGARHGRHGLVGGEGEELCGPPIAVCAHDPALIPEQAHGNMAACTTTVRGEMRKRALEGREKERLVRLFDSARSFSSLCWCSQLPQVGLFKCQVQDVYVLFRQKITRCLVSRPIAWQHFESFTRMSL